MMGPRTSRIVSHARSAASAAAAQTTNPNRGEDRKPEGAMLCLFVSRDSDRYMDDGCREEDISLLKIVAVP
jgi:hypothetical protein